MTFFEAFTEVFRKIFTNIISKTRKIYFFNNKHNIKRRVPPLVLIYKTIFNERYVIAIIIPLS